MLAAEDPIAQVIRSGRLAKLIFRQPFDRPFDGLGRVQAVDHPRIDQRAIFAGVGRLVEIPGLGRHDHRDNRQVELPGKRIIPFVVGRHRHDGARPVRQ